jgi:hypothetical protein
MTITAPAPMAATGGLDGTQVVVAGFQRLLVAAVGSDFPEGIGTEPDADWTDLGYTTEDGITFSFGLDTDDLMTSQSLDPVRKLTTARPKTVAGSLRQFNRDTLTLALGGGTWTGDDDEGWEFHPALSSFIDERAVIVEFADGDKRARFCGRRTMVSEAVEFTLVNTAGVAFPLTFSVLAAEPDTFFWQTNGAMLGAGGGGGSPFPPADPTLSGVQPQEGEAGDTVALTGANFAANMTVTFGTTAATGVVRTSATAATCTVPAGEGTVDVVVMNPGAATPGRLADAFTYAGG